MDLLGDLTAAQREAVTHIDGPLLVLAGAGSGKTRVITRRVAHLLSADIPGDRILALTFTNKAAGEMRARIEQLGRDARVWVGTFHGFCAGMLRKRAPLVGIDASFSIYDQSDRLRAIKDLMEQLGWNEANWGAERIEAAISRAKNDLIGPTNLHHHTARDWPPQLAHLYRAYEDRLRGASAVDFDDLLVHLVTILREHKDVRAELDARYRYVLVDEYQDTNLAQYAIVRALSVDHPNICVTGDPDQSIYGWRGANLSNILEFEHDFPGCRVVTLARNYRSTKNIIRVADHLIRFNHNRKDKSLSTENVLGAPVELTIYPRESDEAESIAARIAAMVRQGENRFSDIAVFCRTTALSRPLEQAFRAARIPYQVVGGVAFYERQEVKDVLAYLSLMANPKDDLAFSRVANVPPRGLGKTSLDHLATAARERGTPLLAQARAAWTVPALKEKAAKALDDFAHLVEELAALGDRTVYEIVTKLLERTGYREHLKAEAREKGEDRVANLDELIATAREFDEQHPGSSLEDFLAEVSLASAVDRWDHESGAVALMTLHAAKGLEFPVVFIVALEEGLLPHVRANGDASELEEERRLLFVGITRARRELCLSRCVERSFRGQLQATTPSRFLGELPLDSIEVHDLSGIGAAAYPATPAARGRFGTGTGKSRSGEPAAAFAPQEFRLLTAAELPAALGMASPGRAAAPVKLEAFRVGVAVVHPEFGLGKIVEIVGAGPNRKGRVAFAVGPVRTFVLSQSPLRPVGRAALDEKRSS
jgi:DNA helicase-2/ATP-dependent DNA helicase PcrA